MRFVGLFLYGAFLLCIVAASLVPDFLDMGFYTDKVLHSFLVCMALLWPCLSFSRWRSVFMLCGIIFLGSLAIEGLQTLTPDRHAELGDIAANIIGIMLGLLIGWLLRSGYYEAKLQA